MKFVKITLLSLLFVLACDTVAEVDTRVQDLLTQGWTSFESKEYEAAKQSFHDAYNIDNQSVQSVLGLSLSSAKLGELDTALFYINTGITLADSVASWYAAKGFVLNAKSDFASSNSALNTAIEKSPNWTFTRGLNLSTTNIYATKAANFYNLNLNSDAIAAIKLIDPDFSDSATRSAIGEKIQSFNSSLIVF